MHDTYHNQADPKEDVTSANLNDLLLLPHDEIEYAALREHELEQLATQRTEPYIATAALGELTQRRGDAARNAADKILAAPIWDAHLTAYALTTLFSDDPKAAFAHMGRLIDETVEPTILEAMTENVLMERDHFATSEGERFVRKLVGILKSLPPTVIRKHESMEKMLSGVP